MFYLCCVDVVAACAVASLADVICFVSRWCISVVDAPSGDVLSLSLSLSLCVCLIALVLVLVVVLLWFVVVASLLSSVVVVVLLAFFHC